MKRMVWVLAAILLLAAAMAGCSPDTSDTTGSQDTQSATGDTGAGDTSAGNDDAATSGPAELAAETDSEKEALALADSEEARLWGSGDTVSGTPVEGDPFLVGYGVLLHDGATQYQVVVLDGTVQGFFGNKDGLRYMEAPFADYNPTIDPASERQREAFEAAKTEIAAVNPNATQGGIETYYVFYPSTLEGTFPSVSLYVSPTMVGSPWASGGSYGWR